MSGPGALSSKRAREVLAIVARSGKYLPVGLTFGPVNGPDDFNFVVDRAFSLAKAVGYGSQRNGWCTLTTLQSGLVGL